MDCLIKSCDIEHSNNDNNTPCNVTSIITQSWWQCMEEIANIVLVLNRHRWCWTKKISCRIWSRKTRMWTIWIIENLSRSCFSIICEHNWRTEVQVANTLTCRQRYRQLSTLFSKCYIACSGAGINLWRRFGCLTFDSCVELGKMICQKRTNTMLDLRLNALIWDRTNMAIGNSMAPKK